MRRFSLYQYKQESGRSPCIKTRDCEVLDVSIQARWWAGDHQQYGELDFIPSKQRISFKEVTHLSGFAFSAMRRVPVSNTKDGESRASVRCFDSEGRGLFVLTNKPL